mmetsp:Transcript_2636/g.6177  ORF Transcript_2636/g.6177 Transcript_2636/m.6177 type:complete len:362 (-) Transcript_2636:220-1305(-)|eukprot:CAMPEP_0171092318 /NCGR_PEP_ID=MMETSP0766_2-20121228/35618_1 /TAXON_ID=439317 /ORGANISM="Gambierdiscus australes, Strain CAWD 149" /LENGTH=361 /DNA_ID=CAMNT_0011550535 /DNA_START=64 /DNA_END=1149 /DNA_ORIENTATION=-
MWGKSKKKLAAVNLLIDETNKEINVQKSELAKVNAEIEACERETQQIKANADVERKGRQLAEAQNNHVLREIEQVSTEIAEMKQRIMDSKASAEEARREKEGLISELARHEEIVRREHSATEAAATAARKQAEELQAEQEAERRRWQVVREAHEELRQHVEAATRQCEEAKTTRDQARVEWAAAQEDLRELRLSQGQMREECRKAEASLASQKEQHRELEEELRVLRDQHRQVLAATKVLEEDHKHRQFVLQSVSQNLDDKRGHLQRELGEFQEKFQRAKAQHEQVIVEQGQIRGATNAVLPEYFKLQTDHAARARELEQAKREHELLSWEHHKVQRDVQMLSNSYDAGFLPQLPATSGPH